MVNPLMEIERANYVNKTMIKTKNKGTIMTVLTLAQCLYHQLLRYCRNLSSIFVSTLKMCSFPCTNFKQKRMAKGQLIMKKWKNFFLWNNNDRFLFINTGNNLILSYFPIRKTIERQRQKRT